MQSGLHKKFFRIRYYFFFSDYFSQLLAGSAICGALQLQGQDMTRGKRLAAVEMTCQMAPGTLGRFSFHSCFIAVAVVWYIRHQISFFWRQITPILAPMIREITAHTFQITRPHLGKPEMTNELC